MCSLPRRRRQQFLGTLAATLLLSTTTAASASSMRAAMARTTSTAFSSPILPTYSTSSTALAPFSSSPNARANVLRRHAFAKGRPSLDDVERLSHGQAAKKRGTGSRNICHRLNEMERKEFDLAKKMGFVQLRGTGYRRERKGSPLANIHRQLCDALGRPCIEVHRGLGTDATDEVVVDLSPYRPVGPVELDAAWEVCVSLEKELMPPTEAAAAPAAAAVASPTEAEGVPAAVDVVTGEGGEEVVALPALRALWEQTRQSFEEDDWEKKPIWDLPVLSYVYDCTGDRALAKKIAQEAHARLGKLTRKR